MKLRLDFISSDRLSQMQTMEKVDLIIDKIKNNIIVVLEEGLTPREESELIEATMREIDTEKFHGIEFYRMDYRESLRSRLASYIAGRKNMGLTIVGPTRIIEAIKREPDCISMIAKVKRK